MHRITSILLALSLVVLINGIPFIADNKNPEQGIVKGNLQACLRWYDNEGDPNVLLAQTAKPPCQVPTTFLPNLAGGWSMDTGCDAAKQPNTCDLHKGAHCCYRHAYASSGPGAQACYDTQGNWISDPWKGAGTLDAVTPLGNFIAVIQHGIRDVIPYYDCCTGSLPQPSTCNLYYEKRPPGQCEGTLVG
jgi:hypothetical protein